MKCIQGLFLLLAALFLLTSSCNDPTNVGTGLLEQDQAEVGFSDTISIVAQTIVEDSVLSYSLSSPLQTMPFGNYADPVFGKVTASIYTELALSSLNPDFTTADPSEIVIDSVILSMTYDSTSFYGNISQLQTISVAELIESIEEKEEIFSNEEPASDLMTVGSIEFTPSFPDSGEAVSQLKIPLSLEFGEKLLFLGEEAYENDSLFSENFPGIHLFPDNAPIDGMMGFRVRNPSSTLTVYFTRNDTVSQFYIFRFIGQAVNFVNYKHDFSGAVVEPFLNDAEKGDSLLFLQGLAGPFVKLEFPELEQYQGFIVNKAELEVPISFDPVDPNNNGTIYPFVDRLLLSEDDSDGEGRVLIEDLVIAVSRGSLSIFGGTWNTETFTYTMNLSAHFQDVIDGKAGNILYLSPFLKPEIARRSVVHGPEHSTNPMRLKLTFTK